MKKKDLSKMNDLQKVNWLIEFFDNVDLSERTKTGVPTYKPGDITRALKDTADTIKNLQDLEKRVFEEVEKKSIRGNKDINPLEI